MYNRNSTRMEYFRNLNEQQYENYDDDFKWVIKEAKPSKDKYEKEERMNKSFINFIFRKLGNRQ